MEEEASVTVMIVEFEKGRIKGSRALTYDYGRSFVANSQGELLVFDEKGSTIATHAAGFWTMAQANVVTA